MSDGRSTRAGSRRRVNSVRATNRNVNRKAPRKNNAHPTAVGAELAESLRSIQTPRERREALRRAAPSASAASTMLAEARAWRRRDPEAAARLARSVLLVARAAGSREIAGEAFHILGQAEIVAGRPRHAL